VQPNGSNPGGNTPQAFLTILFFDERCKFIAAADGGVAQQQVDASVTADGSTLVRNDIKAPKNGYAYVYVSNQSNQDVFFDNFKVQIVTGNIIEENHYYAYGLKIAAISSKKLGDTYEGVLKNNYLYQGAYSEMDDDIGWNDFALRNYDPQIGRWVQQDPYAAIYISSSYSGMGCNPITLIDPGGGNIFSGTTAVGRVVATTVLGAIIGGIAELVSGGDTWTGVAVGAGIGLTAGLINNISVTSMIVKGAGIATTVINTSVISNQAGTAIRGNQASSKSKGPFEAIHDSVRDWFKDVNNEYVADFKTMKIWNALFEAKQMLDNRIRSLGSWGPSEQNDFKTIFGRDDLAARNLIMERMIRVKAVIDKFMLGTNYKKQFFETKDDSYAHVYSGDPDLEIYLDKLFWTAPLIGRDSQAGTIIHEISHFKFIGGTKDHEYGLTDAKQLAIDNPNKALRNADNFEFYLEGGPY